MRTGRHVPYDGIDFITGSWVVYDYDEDDLLSNLHNSIIIFGMILNYI